MSKKYEDYQGKSFKIFRLNSHDTILSATKISS